MFLLTLTISATFSIAFLLLSITMTDVDPPSKRRLIKHLNLKLICDYMHRTCRVCMEFHFHTRGNLTNFFPPYTWHLFIRFEPTILGPTQDSNSSGHRGPSFGCPLSFSVTRKRDEKGRELEGGTNCCFTFYFI